jgi:hypothetical protein
MSNNRHLVLAMALIAALALAAVWGAAGAAPSPHATVTALTSDRDSEGGWPPTTGPTNPSGYRT